MDDFREALSRAGGLAQGDLAVAMAWVRGLLANDWVALAFTLFAAAGKLGTVWGVVWGAWRKRSWIAWGAWGLSWLVLAPAAWRWLRGGPLCRDVALAFRRLPVEVVSRTRGKAGRYTVSGLGSDRLSHLIVWDDGEEITGLFSGRELRVVRAAARKPVRRHFRLEDAKAKSDHALRRVQKEARLEAEAKGLPRQVRAYDLRECPPAPNPPHDNLADKALPRATLPPAGGLSGARVPAETANQARSAMGLPPVTCGDALCWEAPAAAQGACACGPGSRCDCQGCACPRAAK